MSIHQAVEIEAELTLVGLLFSRAAYPTSYKPAWRGLRLVFGPVGSVNLAELMWCRPQAVTGRL